MEEKSIYYQSSLPRSGSTLLQNVFAQNPEFYATPTSGVLELIFQARESYGKGTEWKAQDAELMAKGMKGFYKGALQGFFNGITDKPRVIDKNRGWAYYYTLLKTFDDNPKIIYMVRDLKDVYTSMEKNFRKNPEKSKQIVHWGTGQGVTIKKRIELWASSPLVGGTLEKLKEVIDTGVAHNIFFIKYEDFTANPKAMMERVYAYLDIPNYKHDFKNILQITQEDDRVHGDFGDHTIRKEIKPLPSQAQEILGRQNCKDIMNTYEWYNEYFNY